MKKDAMENRNKYATEENDLTSCNQCVANKTSYLISGLPDTHICIIDFREKVMWRIVCAISNMKIN